MTKQTLFAAIALSAALALPLAPAFAHGGDTGTRVFDAGDKEKKDDPGYTTYKEGYDLILDEEWADARKKFKDLLTNFPKSEYADDASYWSAYAEKNIDEKASLKEYKAFIAKYPNSSYFDDAIADMASINGNATYSTSGELATPAPRAYYVSPAVPSRAPQAPQVARAYRDMSRGSSNSSSSGGHSYSYGYAYTMPPNIALSQDRLRRSLRRMRIPGFPRAAGGEDSGDDSLDEASRLKIDALEALGDAKEDSTSFKTLRDVALDKSQPKELRVTAMDQLADFKKFDVLPVFVDVAKNDTDTEIQDEAIDVIGDVSHDKNRSVETLIEIFHNLPKSRTDQRATVFYSIAEVGNDKAVDFLADVAKSDADYELRSQAVYYLGSIGGEKARAALYRILKEK